MYRPDQFQYFYWPVENIVVGCTEKAAATSIRGALIRCKKYTYKEVQQRGYRSRIYLRHPITRFASAWAYFTPANNFPGDPVWRNKAYDALRDHPTVEQFTDAVLDGMQNEHWAPQLAQHGLVFDEILRLENIRDTWPERYRLENRNQGRIPKPEITYRLDELENYYKEDLAQWQTQAS